MGALMPTYNRYPAAFERGEGARLFAEDGREFIDFGAGIAVNSFGHANPHLKAALVEQADKLWHTSNLYRIPAGERLAQRLCDASFADLVFFNNSGAEAVETAIKTARKYHSARGEAERYRVITFAGAFHGRTLATIAAGGKPQYLDGFGPACPGFDQVEPGDLKAAEAAITDETAAMLIEPVQGEGGIRVMEPEFLKSLRKLCDEAGILLIYDEVQCGMGRTGRLFAHERAGAAPDIMAIAKALGGGFPIGACLTTREAASGMTAGVHGTTFGGNPLAMAVGNAVMDIVEDPAFMEGVRARAGRLNQNLAALVDAHPDVLEGLRGQGLMLGLKCRAPNTEVARAAFDEGVLVVGAGENVVRLVPPLTITDDEMDAGLARLDAACAAVAEAMKKA
jgi:acetylornithine/N-succinyldiaminopimelate aminotransferase